MAGYGDLGGDSFSLFLVKSFGGDVKLRDGIALTLCQVSKYLLPLKKTHFLGQQGAHCRVFCVPTHVSSFRLSWPSLYILLVNLAK